MRTMALRVVLAGLLFALGGATAQSHSKHVAVPDDWRHRGHWVLLTDCVAADLKANTTKEYLYVYQDRWYLSARTKLVWRWDIGQQLPGTYRYFDGAQRGSFECTGSDETPAYGVGCSDGPGPLPKVLPYYENDSRQGEATICQDIPDAFGVGACGWATIYVRESKK
jgi:hypothetical protein